MARKRRKPTFRAHLGMHLCTTPKGVCLFWDSDAEATRDKWRKFSGHVFRPFLYFDSHTHYFASCILF